MATCPFGPELQKYWDRRHILFSRFDEGIAIDAEGLYSVCPEDVALEIAEKITSSTVLDAFGGVGGNAIAFARKDKQVWCVDTDGTRLNMAQQNARVYGVDDRITFIQGNFFAVAKEIPAEAIFIDPPWGGPSYSQKEQFLLRDFHPDGNAILAVSFQYFSEVVIRVPKNFSISEIEQLGRPYDINDNYSHGKLISRTIYFEKK